MIKLYTYLYKNKHLILRKIIEYNHLISYLDSLTLQVINIAMYSKETLFSYYFLFRVALPVENNTMHLNKKGRGVET